MTKAATKIIARVPDLAEYLRLRSIAGLSAFFEHAANKGLHGTWFAVVAEKGGKSISMGRWIGDGGCFCQVVDIALDPPHQGQGKAIMAGLTADMTEHLPPSVYVSWIADVPANKLYQLYGVQETAPRSIGMARRAG